MAEGGTPGEADVAQLHEAAKQGDGERVAALLRTADLRPQRAQRSALVEARDQHGYTALHHAANRAVTQLLLDAGADPTARGRFGSTPVHEAAQRGDADSMRLLLEHGANATARTDGGTTPLHCAATSEVVRLLLAHGAQLEATTNGTDQTPLGSAVARGSFGAMEALVAAGADVNHGAERSATPLQNLCNAGNPETDGLVARVQFLLAAGARHDIASTLWAGYFPLHLAAWRGNRRVVEMLVAAGANLQARTPDGRTPLDVARVAKRTEIETFLRARWEPREVSPAPLEGPPVAWKVVVHPTRAEAITTVQYGALIRWALEDPPRLLASRQTAYYAMYCPVAAPDGSAVAVGPPTELIELRRWDDLALVQAVPFPDSRTVPTIALSPDGRWLAADAREEVRLVERATGRVTARVESGERDNSLVFDPSSQLLAAACSFQAGGHVRVDRVGADGSLTPLYELERSAHDTPSPQFVDTLANLAFSPDSRHLALFQTSAIAHAAKPPGWRGDLVLYELERGTVAWQRSVDASITGDRRVLAEAGHPMGFWTEVTFMGPDRLPCGATGGLVLCFDVATGALVRRIELGREGAVTSLAFHAATETLWAVVGGALVKVLLDS